MRYSPPTTNGISWDKGAFTSKTSKIPAVVVTYAGTESPLGEKIKEVTALTQGEDASSSRLVQLSDEKKQTNYLSSKETWVALHDIGNPTLFFDRVLPASRTGPVSVGEILKANRNVSVTSGPPNWAPQPSALEQR